MLTEISMSLSFVLVEYENVAFVVVVADRTKFRRREQGLSAQPHLRCRRNILVEYLKVHGPWKLLRASLGVSAR